MRLGEGVGSGGRVAALLTLAACGANSPGAVTISVRDSAGVTIVENTGPSAPTELLTVAAEPFLDLSREDDENHQFYGAFGGLRLADGTYVIANTIDRSIRYYSPDGEWLRSFGR